MSTVEMVIRRGGLLVVVLLAVGAAWVNDLNTRMSITPAFAADQSSSGEAGSHGAGSQTLSPHSDLIFRATGATSCRDCHRMGANGSLSPQPMDNDLVKTLRAKAKAVHGPGRFADCLRCHAGGRKGVEKY